MKLTVYGTPTEELQVLLNMAGLLGHTIEMREPERHNWLSPVKIVIDEESFFEHMRKMAAVLGVGSSYGRRLGKSVIHGMVPVRNSTAQIMVFDELTEFDPKTVGNAVHQILMPTHKPKLSMKKTSGTQAPTSKGDRKGNKRYRWS